MVATLTARMHRLRNFVRFASYTGLRPKDDRDCFQNCQQHRSLQWELNGLETGSVQMAVILRTLLKFDRYRTSCIVHKCLLVPTFSSDFRFATFRYSRLGKTRRVVKKWSEAFRLLFFFPSFFLSEQASRNRITHPVKRFSTD